MSTEDKWSALEKTLGIRVQQVDRYSSNFFWVRLIFKGSLIILSAIVAAEKSFDFCGWQTAISILAILVAVGTAADAWIRPAEKWRLSSSYTTQFEALHRKVQGLDHADGTAIDAAEKDFADLQSKWLKDTTY
jgi:hypothetical protein